MTQKEREIYGHLVAYEFLLEIALAQIWAIFPDNIGYRAEGEIISLLERYWSRQDIPEEDAIELQNISSNVTKRIIEKAGLRSEQIHPIVQDLLNKKSD